MGYYLPDRDQCRTVDHCSALSCPQSEEIQLPTFTPHLLQVGAFIQKKLQRIDSGSRIHSSGSSSCEPICLD